MAKILMVQGCASNVGKSLWVSGLCYWLRQQNVRVYPFKPQNMSLNSISINENQEMARAQFVQALACGVRPSADMSPVLLKPESEQGAQLVIQGQVAGRADAKRWRDERQNWLPAVLESFDRICSQAEVVIIEGAGSPAEINLRQGDIANMGFAQLVQSPVLLIGDIDCGGVFAQLYGTLSLLSSSDRSLVKALLINRFRGDMSLLKPGLDWLVKKTNQPLLGVMPYLKDIYMDAEDSLSTPPANTKAKNGLKVGIIRYPKMSNVNDFELLLQCDGLSVQWLLKAADYQGVDLIILPGSKSVISDLLWLRAHDFEAVLKRHLRYGGCVFGICGGFQMLGNTLDNQSGKEGQPGVYKGLGLIDMATHFMSTKKLGHQQVHLLNDNKILTGYHMHTGCSLGDALKKNPLFECVDKGERMFEGYMSNDKQLFGSYLHGLFDDIEGIKGLLNLWGFKTNTVLKSVDQLRDDSFQKLAQAIDQHLDLELIEQIINP